MLDRAPRKHTWGVHPAVTGALAAAALAYTIRTNLLNWCNLVSISKNLVFYAFVVERIY